MKSEDATNRGSLLSGLEEQHAVGVLVPGEFIAKDYEVLEYKGGGGSGEVYRVRHPQFGDTRVIKLFIPYYYIRQLALPTIEDIVEEDTSITQLIMKSSEKLYSSRHEFKFLSSVDHPFIVKVHAHSRTALDPDQFTRLKKKLGAELTENRNVPYIIAAHVDGEKLTPEFARLGGREMVFTALRGVAQALDYIHREKALLHCDVKAGNVLVRPDGFPMLVDFALSLDVAGGDDDEIIVASIDSDYAPPVAAEPAVQRAISRLAREGMQRAEVRKTFFPHLDRYQFGKLISECLPGVADVLSDGEFGYLDGLATRLTDWKWLSEHADISLSDYASRLDTNRTYPILRVESAGGGIRLPAPTGAIKVAGPLVQFALHPSVVRLNRLNQLSLLPARFPGATHTRFLHSLDTYRLTRGLTRRLLDNPRFRILFNERDVKHLLLTAMLHDINHVPLMHVFQESELKVYESFDLFEFNLAATYPGVAPLGDMIESEMGVARFLRIIGEDWEDQSGDRIETDQVMSSILNAGVDVDKLSYLRLDSLFSGREFASTLDIEGLFEAADIVKVHSKTANVSGHHLAFNERAIPLLESVIGARLRAFQELYWCAENRAMMACVLHRVREVNSVGGEAVLDDLIRKTTSLPDYSVLLQLDALAEEFGLGGPRVSSFFETFADQVESVYRGSRYHGVLLKMTAEDRAKFDNEFRTLVLTELGVNGATNEALVLVDAPRRELNLGGRVVVGDHGGGVPLADVSAAVRAHEESFTRLRQEVQVLCSSDIADALRSKVEPGGAGKWIDDRLKELLKAGTFR